MSATRTSIVVSGAAETEARWRELHRDFALQLAASARVRDGAGAARPAAHVDERLVQAIWSDQLLRGGELATASGKAVEVIEPGRWNTGAGPDFLDARVRIAGEVVEGDVEIHVQSADWKRHGHHQDFVYNRVILHVALVANDDRPHEESQNGGRIERLVLDGCLEPDLETIRSTINPADYPFGRPDDLGLCHEQFMRLPREQLVEFLLLAGRSRMEQKIARFAAQRATAPFPQVIYQALLTGQGFKASKTLYFLLSKRAPLAELMDYATDIDGEERVDFFLSVFLHVAQLLPPPTGMLPGTDEETDAFRERMERLWKPVRPYLSDRLVPPTKRWFAGMRPAGFPTRRLAAAATLVSRLTDRQAPLFERIRGVVASFDSASMTPKRLKAFWRSLAENLTVEGTSHYFGTHFTLGGKKQAPQALLGEPAALSLLFNVFLPLLVLHAREMKNGALEGSAWDALQTFPALEENSVTRFMARRLFGDAPPESGLFKREIFQQSLFKVFSDCCSQNERTCEHCTFFALAERLSRGGAA